MLAPLPLPPYRVAIVDDHPLVRKGLVDLMRGQPRLEACGEAATIAEALALCDATNPHVAVIDLWLGPESGLDLVTRLSREMPAVRTLVLSGADEQLFAERALRAGALGYVMKDAPPADVVAAVRRVAEGRMHVSEAMSAQILSTAGRRPARVDMTLPIDRLSDRERHVLVLIGRGLGTTEIARQLSLSVKTVESHYAHIKAKLGLRNGRELTRVGISWANGGLA